MTVNLRAIQDTIPDNHCIGCGPDNEHGLRIKSTWCGDLETECRFEPQPHMASAPASILNGGIIATLIDCHAVGTSVGYGRRLDGLADGEPGALYATGSLEIRYLRPAAIDRPVHLKARITGVSARKTVLECTVVSDGEICATATVVAVRVASGWGRDGADATRQSIPAPDQTLGGRAAGARPRRFEKTA
jgi:acyl-coenzyme A thioesterase PaaI-like protein